MAFYIRIEDEDDLRWLQGLLDRAVYKIKNNLHEFDSDLAAKICRVHDAAHSGAPTKDAKTLGVPVEVLEQDAGPKKPNPKDDYVPRLCEKHPKKEMKRAPRIDCEGCWDAYKRLHPIEYPKARLRFERNMSTS